MPERQRSDVRHTLLSSAGEKHDQPIEKIEIEVVPPTRFELVTP